MAQFCVSFTCHKAELYFLSRTHIFAWLKIKMQNLPQTGEGKILENLVQ